MRTTIEDSVREELVYIGMTKNLHAHADGQIHHADAKCPPYGEGMRSQVALSRGGFSSDE